MPTFEAQPAEDEAVKELLFAASAFREYVDRIYNTDPTVYGPLSCREQQRLWRAIDAIAQQNTADAPDRKVTAQNQPGEPS